MLSIDKELQAIGQRCIPNAPFDSWGQTGSTFYANLSRHNGAYRGTDYYYEGEYKFLHFTRFEYLFSILNEQAFRFYDLNSSEDEDEYLYAAEILNVNENKRQYAKQNLYTFSCCPISEIHNEHVWKEFGKDYSGAAIVFEIINDPMKWDNFHLGLIKYSVPDSFAAYSEELFMFQLENGIDAEMDLSKLIAFHKKEKWANEKEIRILTYYPFDNLSEKFQHLRLDYRRKEGRNRLTRYFNLPLWVDGNSYAVKTFNPQVLQRFNHIPPHFFVERPKIVIKDILIGANSRLSIKEFLRMVEELEEIITYNLGYDVKISRSMHSPKNS
jgi:hypothetical protein